MSGDNRNHGSKQILYRHFSAILYEKFLLWCYCAIIYASVYAFYYVLNIVNRLKFILNCVKNGLSLCVSIFMSVLDTVFV